MIKKNTLFIITCLIISSFLVGCNSEIVFTRNKDFKNEQWHKDSLAVFDIEITDTNQIYNLFLHTRINGKYEYSNMYLFVSTNLPQNKQITDTVDYILAMPNGKWTGKGFGNLWTYKFPYRTNVKFPFAGQYTFIIQQAMRTDNLKYVLNVGISLEKVEL